jgi:hypothetical protein
MIGVSNGQISITKLTHLTMFTHVTYLEIVYLLPYTLSNGTMYIIVSTRRLQ